MTIRIAGPNKFGNYCLYRSATNQGVILSCLELHRLLTDIDGALHDKDGRYIPLLHDPRSEAARQRHMKFGQADLFDLFPFNAS